MGHRQVHWAHGEWLAILLEELHKKSSRSFALISLDNHQRLNWALPGSLADRLANEQHGVRYTRHQLDALCYVDVDEHMPASPESHWFSWHNP